MTSKIFSAPLKLVTVDDSPIVAARVKQILSDLDRVEFLGNAPNINLAKKLIEENVPDVLILDIHLADDAPEASGINLLMDLRDLYPNMVIIMLTNMIEQHYKNICINLGADYFLDKSIDFEKIPDIIQTLQEDKN
jgi:DNA-binding NarL/FixJ family response regulator